MKVKSILKKLLVYLLITNLVFQACKKETNTTSPSDNKIPETTKIIEPQIWKTNFIGVDSTNFTFSFDKNLSSELSLKEGDIIVSTDGYGFIRKITNITERGDSLIIETGFARLTEIVNEGKTSFSSLLSTQKIMKINYHKNGVVIDTSLLKSTEDTPLEYTIDIFLDPEQKIHLQGDFSILTELNGQLEIGWIPPRIELFELTYEINQSLNLSAEIELINFNYAHEVDLMNIYFQPIIAVISGVPVVLVPELEMAAGIETEVDCDLHTGINQELEYIAGVRYEDNEWTTMNVLNKDFNYTSPQLNCNAGARAYIKPQFNILIYGIVAPYLYSDLYSRISADLQSNPWWSLYTGAGIGVGVEAEILGEEIFDFNTDPPLIIFEDLIANAPISYPPIAGFTSNTTYGTVPLEVMFTDQSTNNPTGWHWDFGDGGTSTETNPVHTYNYNGSYTVTLTVTNSAGNDSESKSNYITVLSDNTFIDPRDGKTYNIAEIGTQTWFVENLNFETQNSWWYDNNTVNGETYGRLYNWQAALSACPSGWHLPSDQEWKVLEMHLGMSQFEADLEGLRGTDEGKKLKSISGWNNYGNGDNTSGFTGLPGGLYNTSVFFEIGNYGNFWAADEFSTSNSVIRILCFDDDRIQRGNSNKSFAFSVRCIKD